VADRGQQRPTCHVTQERSDHNQGFRVQADGVDGAVDTNETFSFKFEKPDTYRFSCANHPRMIATITVE
jgi:plastocyanin